MQLTKIFRLDKKLMVFLLWVCFGLGFSMSVILSTIGLMEGFERDLLGALNKVNGDFTISRSLDSNQIDVVIGRLREKFPTLTSKHFFRSDAFLVGESKESKGVSLIGGQSKDFHDLFKIPQHLSLKVGEVLIGEDLSRELNVQVGDRLRALLSGTGKSNFDIKQLTVSGIFKTNIYEKDSRLGIVHVETIQEDLNELNFSIFNFNYPKVSLSAEKERLKVVNNILLSIDEDIFAIPYYHDYATLIEAVEIEKFSILIVLQVIVVVSLFNLLSFLIFFREKKISELFTLNALGVSPRKIRNLWYRISLAIWGGAIVITLVLVQLFSLILEIISENLMPKNIYHLGKINLYLSQDSYLLVFFIGLGWIFLMTFLLTRKFKSDSLLKGLRQQYS